MILGLLDLEYKLYLEDEERVNRGLLGELVREAAPTEDLLSLDAVEQLIADLFPLLNEFFSSLAQARKSRAGISFESHTRFLFRHLAYPFEEQKAINSSFR